MDQSFPAYVIMNNVSIDSISASASKNAGC